MIRLAAPDGEHCVLHDLGGRGAPLLLAHGNGLNAGMWATVVPHLRDGFRCWGLDFRGHGASRQQNDPMPTDRSLFVDEILAAVDALAGEPLLGVGHSLGAACLALAEQRRPGTFRGLYLYDPVLLGQGFSSSVFEGSALVEASRRRRMHFASTQKAFERFVSKPPYSHCEPQAVRAYVELGTYGCGDGGGVRLSCSGETEALIYLAAEPIDHATLAAVSCPTVVARGDSPAQHNQLPPALAQPVAEALADGRVEAFAELSHFGPMEDGARVAAAVRAHFKPLTE